MNTGREEAAKGQPGEASHKDEAAVDEGAESDHGSLLAWVGAGKRWCMSSSEMFEEGGAAQKDIVVGDVESRPYTMGRRRRACFRRSSAAGGKCREDRLSGCARALARSPRPCSDDVPVIVFGARDLAGAVRTNGYPDLAKLVHGPMVRRVSDLLARVAAESMTNSFSSPARRTSSSKTNCAMVDRQMLPWQMNRTRCIPCGPFV